MMRRLSIGLPKACARPRVQMLLVAWLMLVGQGFLGAFAASLPHEPPCSESSMQEGASPVHPMRAEQGVHPSVCPHCHHAGADGCPGLQGCGGVVTLLAPSVVNLSIGVSTGEKAFGSFLPRIASLAYAPPLRPPAA